MTQDEFCDRFVTEMVRAAGPTFGDGSSIADYARDTAPSYFEEEWQRVMGPEECARADISYWEE